MKSERSPKFSILPRRNSSCLYAAVGAYWGTCYIISVSNIICLCDHVETHHVSRELNGDESKTTLGVPLAKVASSTKRTQVQLLVVWDEEVVLGVAAEALCAVPGHVLDRHEGSVGKQDEVEHAVANDGALVLLDHARKDAEP